MLIFYQSRDRTKSISAAVLFLDKTGNFNTWDILIFKKSLMWIPDYLNGNLSILCCSFTKIKRFGVKYLAFSKYAFYAGN